MKNFGRQTVGNLRGWLRKQHTKGKIMMPLLAEMSGSLHIGLAAVGSAIGVGIIIFVSGQKPLAAARVAQISGPEAEAPDGAAVVEISIERPEALASSPYDHYSSGVVSLPQRIELVSFTAPVREDSVPPF